MSKAEEKRQREQLIRQVRRLTRARVNDAVKLAYLSGEALEAIDGLDLTAMTEFKRAGNGAVEIKFTDRLKALEKLMELIRENRETEAEELLRQLPGLTGAKIVRVDLPELPELNEDGIFAEVDMEKQEWKNRIRLFSSDIKR